MPFALKALAKAGLAIGATVTLIGLLARWFPALDIVNNGLPFLSPSRSSWRASPRSRERVATVLSLLLTIINCTHFPLALQGGAEEATLELRASSKYVGLQCLGISDVPNDNIQPIPRRREADLVVTQEMTADNEQARESSWLTLSYTIGDSAS